MKKLLAFALITLSSFSVFAQGTITQPPPSNGKFTGGIMINPFVAWSKANVDDPTKNNVTTNGAQIGFAYGLLGEYFFNNNYGISLNPRVSGYKSEFNYFPEKNSNIISIDRTVDLQYIDIPVCLKMRTNEVGYMKYFAQVGLMPGVKLAARADIDSAFVNATHNNTVKGLDVSKNVNLFMMAFVIGIGAEYGLGATTAIVGSITWNNGFTNVWGKNADDLSHFNIPHQKNDVPPILSNFNSPPSNISLNIGIKF